MGKFKRVFGVVALFMCGSVIGSEPDGGDLKPPTFYVVQTEREAGAQRALEEKLDKPLSMAKSKAPLEAAVKAVADAGGMPMWIDLKQLDEEGIDVKAEIDYGIPGASARTVLETMLSQLNLAWRFHGDVIEITTKGHDSQLFLCVYPVHDLVSVEYDDGSSGQDYESLIEALTGTVEASSWDEVGGKASIASMRGAGAIVVYQSGAAHREIKLTLEKLRAARNDQEMAKVRFRKPLPPKPFAKAEKGGGLF